MAQSRWQPHNRPLFHLSPQYTPRCHCQRAHFGYRRGLRRQVRRFRARGERPSVVCCSCRQFNSAFAIESHPGRRVAIGTGVQRPSEMRASCDAGDQPAGGFLDPRHSIPSAIHFCLHCAYVSRLRFKSPPATSSQPNCMKQHGQISSEADSPSHGAKSRRSPQTGQV
jgi:hypothetical protein